MFGNIANSKKADFSVCLFAYLIKDYLPSPICSIKALVCGL